MLPTLIIVFREVLEAALVVVIVMAASAGIARRNLWIGGGLAVGLLGSGVVAVFAQAIASAAQGMGQELFNALVLFAAVAMLGWHNIWMTRHGRELALQATETGRAVRAGQRPYYVLAVVVGLAVLREGSEVVLFLYGIAAAGGGDATAMLSGGLLGLAAGVAFGAALYFGLLRIPTRYLFSVTNWMILLLAAGMASQGASFLVQAGLLPPLGTAVWDTSAWLTERSLAGKTLHTLIGYTARPDGIQIVFYWITIAVIGALMLLLRTGGRGARVVGTGALVLVALALLFVAETARAELRVYSQVVVQGETEAELAAAYPRNGTREDAYTVAVGYGVTGRWATELELELVRGEAPGGGRELEHEATAWENRVQLTEQGAHVATVGVFAAYERAAQSGHPDEWVAGPLLEAELGRTLHTANLLFERQTGDNAEDETELVYAWQSRWRLLRPFEPGFEIFGGEHHNVAGPVVRGKLGSGTTVYGYELGYLFGLDDESPNHTLKASLELELY